MDFLKQKKTQLEKKDKSNIGSWDKEIIKLCNKINKKKEYYTTSSCSGRIVLLKEHVKKLPGLFLFRIHNRITLKQLKKELGKAVKDYRKMIYFKTEPCRLHVAAQSLKDSQILTDKSKISGWKKSGIMASNKRFMVEMISTENIEMPIADRGKILVSDDFLKILVREANARLMRTRKKIKNLERLI